MRFDTRDLGHRDLAHRDLGHRLPEALASGALTFAWYALPDAVASRRARGVAKAALFVPMAAIGVMAGRRDAAAEAADDAADPAAHGRLGRIRALTHTEPVLDLSAIEADAGHDAGAVEGRRLAARIPSARQAALIAAGLAVVAVSAAGFVATERGVHRYGERLGARGVRLPHTRIGVVAGLASVGLSLATDQLPVGPRDRA